MTSAGFFRAIAPRRLALWGAALATPVLLAACASPGPEHHPLAATTAQAAGLSSTPSSALAPAWWEPLGDPQLGALITQALQGNPSLAASRARMAQAMALSQVREAADGPQLGLGVDLNRQHYTAHGLVPAPVAGNSYSTGNLQTTLSWAPDFFGQHASELQAALGQARAAQADSAAAANLLAAQVARSYVGLARLVAQRGVAERTLAQRQEQLALTRQRVAAGLDSQVELSASQTAIPDAQAQREALDEQITLARRQLAVLSGQAPQALDDLRPALASLQPIDVPPTLGADLLGRRPDVQAARWRIEAATHNVAAAHSEFYPNINLTAFIGLNALGLDRLFTAGSRQLGVAPALRLPLFDGGRLRAQLGSKQAELDAAIAQYNGLVLDAAREAGDALASLQSLQRQQEQQSLAAAGAEKTWRLAQERYQAGLGGYLAVLASENQVLAQRRQAVDLQARQIDTRIALMKALGGGWQNDATPDTTAAH